MFAWLTNYIEIIDKAWLSRTNGKAFVGGAETIDDYVRFIVLSLKKVHKNFPGLINYRGVQWDMDLRAPQVPDTLRIEVDPSATVGQLYTIAQEHHREDDILFLATFFWLVKKRFKRFSLRDCKNAIEAVTARVSDFAIPQEFITNPASYANRSFAEKQGLVAELARSHIGGLGTDFATMLNERSNFFAGEALRVGDVQHLRAVDDMKKRLLVERDARKQLGLL